MRLADVANQYIAEKKPWELTKQDGKDAELHETCSTAMTLFRDLTLYLKPILPVLAGQVEAFLNIPPLAWNDIWKPIPAGHAINTYQHLATRLDPKLIEAPKTKRTAEMEPAVGGGGEGGGGDGAVVRGGYWTKEKLKTKTKKKKTQQAQIVNELQKSHLSEGAPVAEMNKPIVSNSRPVFCVR